MVGDNMRDVSLLTNNGVDVNRGLELLGDREFYNETLGEFLNNIDANKNIMGKNKKPELNLSEDFLEILELFLSFFFF